MSDADSEVAGGMADAGAPPRISWARRVYSRWVIVPCTMAIVIVGWIAYVGAHAHGIVEGRVVDAAGKPVAGAKVLLLKRGFVTHQEAGSTTTDAAGAFRFNDNVSHSIQLEADAPGLGRTDRSVVRLMFAGQDINVVEPLRFSKAQ
jgi:hypothetical protein